MTGSALKKIVSGGQSGVDRAAFDLALELGIACGGWCPKGRYAEDGTIDARYPVTETPTSNVDERTEWNVRDSDGTLILSIGEPKDGTGWTAECARKYSKPVFSIALDAEPNREAFKEWITKNRIQVLNIAGPRESHSPGVIYLNARRLISELLQSLQ